jgi:PKD repeat protein
MTNSSSVASGTLTYAWDFGDGATSTSTNPVHSWQATGTYNVKLTASANGCSDLVNHNVLISSVPATTTPSFTVNSSSNFCGNTNVFTNTTQGNGFTYAWDFGDGSAASGTNASRSYAQAGTYNVMLTATSQNGCSASATQNVNVSNAENGPHADFTINANPQCVTDNRFVFSNASTSSGTAWIPFYNWDFGNGANSTASWPTDVLYGAPGAYTDTLTAIASNGCSSTVAKVVTVNPSPCSGAGYTSGDGVGTHETPGIALSLAATGSAISRLDAREIELYPNPNHGAFTLQVPAHKQGMYIEIIDMLGRKLYDAQLPAGTVHPIDTQHLLETGAYQVLLYGREETKPTRLAFVVTE